MGAFIEAIDLHKTYRVGKIDVPALRGVSFSVQKGEFVTVVGPSGSGKSTLFYLLGGLTRADSGKVIMAGDDFATLSDAERTRMRKRKIGFVFQKFNLLPTLDARSNIAIAQEIAGNGDRDPAFLSPHLRFIGTQQATKPSPVRTFRRRATARSFGSRPRQQASGGFGRRAHGQSGHRELERRLENVAAVQPGIRPDRADDHPQPRGSSVWRPDHSYARWPHREAGRRSAVGASLKSRTVFPSGVVWPLRRDQVSPR